MLIYTKEGICPPNTKLTRSLAITKHKKSQLETTLSKLSDMVITLRSGYVMASKLHKCKL